MLIKKHEDQIKLETWVCIHDIKQRKGLKGMWSKCKQSNKLPDKNDSTEDEGRNKNKRDCIILFVSVDPNTSSPSYLFRLLACDEY